MEMLSLKNNSEKAWEIRLQPSNVKLHFRLLNILPRFRNLGTLHLLLPHITQLFTETTFENNTKLVHLEICHDDGACDVFPENLEIIIKNIKKSCHRIECIRIIGPRDVGSSRLKYLRKLFHKIKIEAS